MNSQVLSYVSRSILCFVSLLLVGPGSGFAAPGATHAPINRLPASRNQIAPDRILVRFKPQSTPALRSWVAGKFNARVLTDSRSVPGLQVIQVNGPSALDATLSAYRRDPNVLYAEPDYRVQFEETLPNDPMFVDLWALRNTGQDGGKPGADLNLARAWDITTGRSDVVVGVIDTGIDYNHPDLAANVWVNANEIAGNGIDDDGNGYVDDVHGINSATGSGEPMDTFGHGTHVSGTIAAHGNNGIGVVGVGWNTKVIACSLFDAETLDAFVSAAVKCLDYLYALKVDRGLDIVATNNSWGWVGESSQALRDAIARQNDAGILFVAAAGNNGMDNGTLPNYPANYTLPNVISVAATDKTDHKAGFSNYGRATVHIAAPGVDINSTAPMDSYLTASGTSMAAPHVVGVLALLKAQDMSRNWVQLKNLVLAGGARADSMGFTITGRRLLAAGDNGTGALTCVDQQVVRRLSPRKNSLVLTYGAAQTITVSLLSIACAQPGGAPRVAVLETGQSIATVDDGLHDDGRAGDGIFAGQVTIPQNRQEPLTLEFPGGDRVTVTFSPNYEVPVSASSQWRDLSSAANEVFLGEDTIHVLPAPFPLRIADRQYANAFLAISDNGYVVPVPDESSAYHVPSLWYNLPLPVEWLGLGMVIAPYWDDLLPGPESRVYWALRGVAPQREWVIEWRSFGHYYADAGTITFQMVMFEDRADILFNYRDVTFGDPAFDAGASASVGIQSIAGIERQLTINSPKLTDGLSLEWRMPVTPPQPKKKDTFLERSFLGGLDVFTLLILGLVAASGRHAARRGLL